MVRKGVATVPAAAAELGTEGWDLVTRPAGAAVEPAHSPGSQRAAADQAERPAAPSSRVPSWSCRNMCRNSPTWLRCLLDWP